MSVALSLKNKGKVMFCIIPEDMLMRIFAENKSENDLLAWMTNVDKLTKVKLNQVLMHIGAISMQQTIFNFEGLAQDKRVGLDINLKCKEGKEYYANTSIIVVGFLLIRHSIELYYHMKQSKLLKKPSWSCDCCGRTI